MQTLSWKNKAGIQIHAAHWAAEQPKAVIALVHGQGEHIGRYAHVAHWYNQRGVAVLGYDQQGFGKSGGPRGHAAGLDAYLDDVALLLDQVQTHYPKVPVFLYGHSMGGNVILNYALRRQPEGLAGIIATAPWIRLAFQAPAWKVIMGRLLRSLVPKLALSTELDIRQLSRVQAVVDAYKADPLVHDKVSAAAGIALIDAAQFLDTYTGKLPAPILLQHGTADGITSMPASKAFAERLQAGTMFQAWPDLFHEIHNETEQQAVFDYTLNWMSKHL